MIGKIKGVDHYTKGVAVVPVFFPNDDVICQNCRYCIHTKGLDRFWCQLEDRQVYFPSECIQDFCPLQFDDKEVND